MKNVNGLKALCSRTQKLHPLGYGPCILMFYNESQNRVYGEWYENFSACQYRELNLKKEDDHCIGYTCTPMAQAEIAKALEYSLNVNSKNHPPMGENAEFWDELSADFPEQAKRFCEQEDLKMWEYAKNHCNH